MSDGDTITVLDEQDRQHKIRLVGIDAPEKAQAFGQQSKASMSGMVFGKTVRADCGKVDRYGRDVCKVWVQPAECPSCPMTLDVGYAQISAGLAWHYRKYQMEQSEEDRARYSDEEVEARLRGRGLWSEADPVAPWEWRRNR